MARFPARAVLPVLVAASLGVGSAFADIALTLLEPVLNYRMDESPEPSRLVTADSLALAVSFVSPYELKSVKALIADREADLRYTGGAYRGSLPLKGLAAGEHRFLIAAEDAFSSAKSDTFTVLYAPEFERQRFLTVEKPTNREAVTGPLAIRASCGMGPGRKCILRAEIKLQQPDTVRKLAERPSAFDTVYDFASEFGAGNDLKTMYLTIMACDVSGKDCIGAVHDLQINLGLKLPLVKAFQGQILDYANGSVLLENSGNRSLGDTSGSVADIGSALGGLAIREGLVAPSGALLATRRSLTDDPRSSARRWFFWQQGRATELMEFTATGPVYQKTIFQGARFAWTQGDNIMLRGIEDSAAEARPFPGLGDMALDRRTDELYAARGGSLYRVGKDSTQLLAVDSGVNLSGLIVVGGKVLYCMARGKNIALGYFDGEKTVQVRDYTDLVMFSNAETHYLLAKGWMAYAKPGAENQSQIWLRDSSGHEKQSTFFSGSSSIEGLSDEGELVYQYAGRRYFRSASGVVSDFAPAFWGRVKWEKGTWYYWFGNALYRIDPAALPMAVKPGGKAGATSSMARGAWEGNGIRLSSHPGGRVRISIRNLQGRRVARDLDLEFGPGSHFIPIRTDGRRGVHLVTVESGAGKWSMLRPEVQ